MRSLTLPLLTVFVISGCAYLPSGLPGAAPKISKPSVVYKTPEIVNFGPESADPKISEQTPEDFLKEDEGPGRFVLDKSKPASFADYKQWRRKNDPGGQVYAEFKQWEAALKERKLRQQKQAK